MILARRLLASVMTTSPLAGTEGATVTLSGRSVRVRALDFAVEKVVERQGAQAYDVDRFVTFSKEALRRAGVRQVGTGDTFQDLEGTTWEMRDALDKGNGMIRATLIKPQSTS